MAKKNSLKAKSLNWTLYSKRRIKGFGKNCLARGKIKFSRDMQKSFHSKQKFVCFIVSKNGTVLKNVKNAI